MMRTCASAALGILALAACKTAPAKSPLVAGHAVPANGLPTDGTITHELAPLLMGRVVLDRDVDVAAHSATLVSTLIEEDASCTDDPPDYEQDYNRYYECHQVDDARTWEAEGVARGRCNCVAQTNCYVVWRNWRFVQGRHARR